MTTTITGSEKIFLPGLMIQQAAYRFPGTRVRLDRPLDIAPELGTAHTYNDLAFLVESTAASLAAAGVVPGDVVAVYKSHNADIMLLACAVARLGAVPAMLAPSLDGDTVIQLLEHLKPAHLITDAARLIHGDLDRVITQLVPSVLLVGRAWNGFPALRDHYGPPPPYVHTDPDATAIITHTSGTTGLPKLVAQSRRGMHAHVTMQRRIAKMLRVKEPYALCISFVHARTYSALAMGLGRGLPFAFLTDHTLDNVRRMFADFRPGLVETHPNTYIQWEELAEEENGPLADVKYYIGTFDAIHPRTVRTLLEASQRRRAVYFQAYGQSETGPVTIRPYSRWLIGHSEGRCVGHPIPGLTRARIGEPVNGGRVGKIEVRSRGQAITYVGQDARFAGQFEDGWWDMTDVGHRGRFGCVHLLDREVDQAELLESVLKVEDTMINRLPQLTELVVVPLDGFLQPVVCTRHDRPLDLSAWYAAVADQPPMARPLQSLWTDLPTTATWKVKRLELRRMLLEAGYGIDRLTAASRASSGSA
jgi:acyl-coenzyme A synthetase/AMP-(fatty) acid ligase